MTELLQGTGANNRPNILILCMDQWDTHMQVPEEVKFPAPRSRWIGRR